MDIVGIVNAVIEIFINLAIYTFLGYITVGVCMFIAFYINSTEEDVSIFSHSTNKTKLFWVSFAIGLLFYFQIFKEWIEL